jgi:hypothetical protein
MRGLFGAVALPERFLRGRRKATGLISVGLTGLLTVLGACGSPDAADRLKLGDPDYPELNPAPTEVWHFTAIVPPSLSATFQTLYVGPGCLRTVGLAVKAPVTVSVPLAGGTVGGSFQSELAVDRFKPGLCSRALIHVSYRVGSGPPRDDELVVYDERDDRPAELKLHLWCIKSLTLDLKTSEVCDDLHGLDFTFPGRIPSRFRRIDTSGPTRQCSGTRWTKDPLDYRRVPRSRCNTGLRAAKVGLRANLTVGI